MHDVRLNAAEQQLQQRTAEEKGCHRQKRGGGEHREHQLSGGLIGPTRFTPAH